MKGNVRERPQAPHTHMQSCTCAHRVRTSVHTLPSGAPGRLGQDSKPKARLTQGEGRARMLQGWTADPVPSVLSRGLWEAVRGGVGRGPAPGQSGRASHCPPSARRDPAPVCGLWRGRRPPAGQPQPGAGPFQDTCSGHGPPQGAGQASLVGVQGGGAGSLSTPLSPASALPRPLPRAPPLLCGPSPVSMGPGREGCWLARPHFLLARRLRAASGTKGGLCLVLGLLPTRPLPPRGPGVMFVFVAKRESSGQAARAQCTDSLGYQLQAQEPGSRQPVPDPAGLPPSPPWPPEAPRQQPGSSVPALRLLLCRLLPSPAHGMRLSSPRPARHPLAL